MFANHRLSFISTSKLLTTLVFGSILASCTGAGDYTPLLNSEPGAGEVITERIPRTRRLFYAALPDVENSDLRLTGPEGDYSLRGMHTMGADDLMIEIHQPALTNGTYTVQWKTRVEADATDYDGEYNFEVSIP